MGTTARNVGPVDRALRIVVGLALLAIAGPDRVWAFGGVLLLATGFSGRCPFYEVIGIDTCGRWHRSHRTR